MGTMTSEVKQFCGLHESVRIGGILRSCNALLQMFLSLRRLVSNSLYQAAYWEVEMMKIFPRTS